MTMKKWAGILGFEGQKTGDGRIIKPGALTWDEDAFPKPFRWASEDHGAHDGASVIGTLEFAERREGGALWGWGYLDLEGSDGQEAERQIRKGMTTGVSLDLDSIAFEIEAGEEFSDGQQRAESMSIGGARMRAVTLVALPAFELARIAIMEDDWQPPNGTAEFGMVETLGEDDSEEGEKPELEDVAEALEELAEVLRDCDEDEKMSLRSDIDAMFATEMAKFALVDDEGAWHNPLNGKYINKPWTILGDMNDALTNLLRKDVDDEELQRRQQIIDDLRGDFSSVEKIQEAATNLDMSTVSSEAENLLGMVEQYEVGVTDGMQVKSQAHLDDWYAQLDKMKETAQVLIDAPEISIDLKNMPDVPGWVKEKDEYSGMPYYMLEAGPDSVPQAHTMIAPHESGKGWGFPDWMDSPSFATPQEAADHQAQEQAEMEAEELPDVPLEPSPDEEDAGVTQERRDAESPAPTYVEDPGTGEKIEGDNRMTPDEIGEQFPEDLPKDLTSKDEVKDWLKSHADVASRRPLHDLLRRLETEYETADEKRKQELLPILLNLAPLLRPRAKAAGTQAFGKLDRSPKKNWVEEQGGLPKYIEEIADELHKKGMTISHAIATAVNTVKRWARGGSAAKGQKGHVSAATVAKAQAALAEWEAKRAAARASRLESGMSFAVIDVGGDWHHPHTGEYIDKPWDLDLDLKNLLSKEERDLLSTDAGENVDKLHNALFYLRKNFRKMRDGVTPELMDESWGHIADMRDTWSLGALKREKGEDWSAEAIEAFEKVDAMIERAEASLEYIETQFLEEEIGQDVETDVEMAVEVPALVASAAPIAPPAAWFADQGLREPTPLTVTKDGQVFGHVALWGVCHTASMGNDCVMVPSSKTDYAMFHLGVVETAEGTEVPVGRLTMRTGHASEYASARKALAHYENTGQAVADVHAGEDAFGVWIAGALRPDVTAEQLRALKSSPLSGDWRYLPSTGSLEMLMVLAVNMPGFPVPRPKGLVASGALRSLQSAGMVAPKTVSAEKVEAAMAGDTLAADDIRYLKQLAQQAREQAADQLRRRVLEQTIGPRIAEMAGQLKFELDTKGSI